MPELINFPVDPLDTPVYRIYPYRIFLQIIQTQKDRLSSPNTWPDPLDNFLLRQTQVIDSDGVSLDPSALANGWYVQCWSLQQNSDAMWRLYGAYKSLAGQGGLASINPQNFVECSVQVKSTPRKLLKYLTETLSHTTDNLFCGYVQYIEEHEFHAKISGRKYNDFLMAGGQKLLAEFMCLKRMAFAHEQEIRLIYQDITVDVAHPPSNFHEFAFDPNTLFDEIVLDPRLNDWEYDQVSRSLLSNGITLNVRQSDLYKGKLFRMPF